MPLDIGYIYDDAGASASDTALQGHLTTAGHTVTTYAESTTERTGHDLVVIGPSVAASAHTPYVDSTFGVLTCHQAVTGLKLGSANGASGTATTQWDLVSTHDINTGFSDPLTVRASSASCWAPIPSNWASGVVSLAINNNDSTKAAAAVAEVNATLTDRNAAGRRGYLAMGAAFGSNLSTDGVNYFLAVVEWVGGTAETGSATVTPSTISIKAGISRAPGYGSIEKVGLTNQVDSSQWITLPAPAGVHLGDLQLAFIGRASYSQTIDTVPEGWILVGGLDFDKGSGQTQRMDIYKSTTSMGTAVWTKSASNGHHAVRVVYKNATAGTPSIQNNTTTSSHAIPQQTTTAANSMVVAFVFSEDVIGQTWAPPVNFTEQFEGTGTGDDLCVSLADRVVASAGTVTGSFTSGTATQSMSASIALTPISQIISGSETVSPSVVSSSIVIAGPTLAAGGSTSATPASISQSVTIAAPTVTVSNVTNVTISPTVVFGYSAIAGYTVTGQDSSTPVTISPATIITLPVMISGAAFGGKAAPVQQPIVVLVNVPPPLDAIEAIERGTVQILRKLEIYEFDATTRWYPDGTDKSRLIGGTVSVDYSRDERRTLDMVLDNFDNTLKPNAYGGLWYDKIIKPYRGVRYETSTGIVEWYFQLGEFLIDNISEENFPHTVSITGRDYTKRCVLSKLEQATSFEAGTKIYDLVKALAANAGITKIQLSPVDDVLPTRLDFDRGIERWSIMKEAANSINRNIYFNHKGYLVWEVFADPALQAASVTFKTGTSGNLVKYQRSVNDSRLYNHIAVYGDPGEGEERLPFIGEAINTEPSSPTRVERIGDRLFTYASTFFTSEEQCQELAEAWLKIYSLESYELDFSSLVYPHLEVGVVAEIIEEDQQVIDPTHFLLDGITLPLGLEPMSGTAKRVSIVRDSQGVAF